MNEEGIKADWLVNNAVIAFFAALLLSQTPQSPTGRNELILGFDVPSTPTFWTDSAIALLLTMSVILAVAGVVPTLRRRAIELTKPLVPTLEFLTWAAFTAGFAQSLQEMPYDQWWSAPFVYGGLTFMALLFVRFVINFAIVIHDRCSTIPDRISSNK